MEKKKYYALTTSITFEKTVLVPVNAVDNIDEAAELVDTGVETDSIILIDTEPYCETSSATFADRNGICEFTDKEASIFQIIGNE